MDKPKDRPRPESLELTLQQSGSKGGKERARRLTKAQRSEIARKGSAARWAKEGVEINAPVQAVYGSPDRPLRISGIDIPCYVLADGRRVLTQRGLQAALGFSRSGGKGRARRLAAFLTALGRKGMSLGDLTARADTDIRFVPPKKGGNPALAYEAGILEELCNVIIEADAAGNLAPNQKHLAVQAKILHRGFAKVGVIALVDEATGFQQDRPAHALAEILDAFIAKELRPWVRRFPFEFYQQIFRLKGWDTTDLTPNSPKPAELGKITIDIIYLRMGPTVIFKDLKRLTPRSEKGYLKNKLHLWLSSEVGDPKLEGHIKVVVAIMKLSRDWQHFMENLEATGIRKYTDNYELPFDQPIRILPPTSSGSPAQ